ncbi:MAG: hypothetical protein QM811_18285 [Pirellulales bacterium]
MIVFPVGDFNPGAVPERTPPVTGEPAALSRRRERDRLAGQLNFGVRRVELASRFFFQLGRAFVLNIAFVGCSNV